TINSINLTLITNRICKLQLRCVTTLLTCRNTKQFFLYFLHIVVLKNTTYKLPKFSVDMDALILF
ncbi:MAG: hypothetical protein WA421_17070, partial [Nitrososphaeraceae archaeon]